MSNKKFYICEKCGNIIDKISDSGVTPSCCGQKMTLLEAGTVEASREKHIPEVKVDGDKVMRVGPRDERSALLRGDSYPRTLVRTQ